MSSSLFLVGAPRAIFLAVLLISFVMTPESLPEIPLCPTFYFLGLHCPGCGMTRAFTCLAHGRLAEAWAHNPFGYLFFLMAIIGAVAPRGWIPSTRLMTTLAVVLVCTMWIWTLARTFAMT